MHFDGLLIRLIENTLQAGKHQHAIDVLFERGDIGAAEAFDFKDVFEAIEISFFVPAPIVDLRKFGGRIGLCIQQRRQQDFRLTARQQNANQAHLDGGRQTVLFDECPRGRCLRKRQFNELFLLLPTPKRLALVETATRQADDQMALLGSRVSNQRIIGIGPIKHQHIFRLGRLPEIFDQAMDFA